MSQTYSDMLAKVKEFHDKHQFSKEEYRGHDMSYRILLTIEESSSFFSNSRFFNFIINRLSFWNV